MGAHFAGLIPLILWGWIVHAGCEYWEKKERKRHNGDRSWGNEGMIRYEPPEDISKVLEEEMAVSGKSAGELITNALLTEWRMSRCKKCAKLFTTRHGRQMHCIDCMIKNA